MIDRNTCIVGAGALMALTLVGTPATAQDKDFWSDTAEPTPTQPSDDDFWSDTTPVEPEKKGDFWNRSSAGEVQRRRNAVIAERNAIREANRIRQEREARIRREEDELLARIQREDRRAQLAREQARRDQSARNSLMRTRNAVMGIVRNQDFGNGSIRQQEQQRAASQSRAAIERRRIEAARSARARDASRAQERERELARRARQDAQLARASKLRWESIGGLETQSTATENNSGPLKSNQSSSRCGVSSFTLQEEQAEKNRLGEIRQRKKQGLAPSDYRVALQADRDWEKGMSDWRAARHRACGVDTDRQVGSTRE